MLYEDVELGESRTSQYSPSVREGAFLNLAFDSSHCFNGRLEHLTNTGSV